MRISRLMLGLVLLAGVMLPRLVSAAEEAVLPKRKPGDLAVLSFNIRYGSANDGPDHWDKRKDLVAQTIKKHAPDLVGTQETLGFQAAYLREQLPEYTFVGVGRDDGKEKGEMAGLFFRSDRFEKLEEGHFWMSQTPETPGSKSWDSSLPRVTSWVKLKEKAGPNAGRSVYFFNTHFDHRGKQARLESAKLIRRKIEELGDAQVILTGDFNTGEGSEPYQVLAKADDAKTKLLDSYRAVQDKPGKEDGTFNGFRGSRDGARIDWILHTPGLKAVGAGIDRSNRDGRYPSDHYPVWALLR